MQDHTEIKNYPISAVTNR